MKGDAKVIQFLNTVLGNELVAINQYFLHSKMHKNWGYSKLAKMSYEESIDEMKHADELADRILMLDGLPNFQKLGKLMIGQDVQETLKCDLKIEHKAIKDLREGIAHCEKVRDFTSRDLLASILNKEEEHIDWLETQLSMIEEMGIENYLLSMV